MERSVIRERSSNGSRPWRLSKEENSGYRPSIGILALQRAGGRYRFLCRNYRPGGVAIEGSKHEPVGAHQVRPLQPTKNHLRQGNASWAFNRGALAPAVTSHWPWRLLRRWRLAAGRPRRRGRRKAGPSKPVTLIVPFAAGGGTDAFARPLTAQLDKQLNQRFLIDNRAGAGGTVGASVGGQGRTQRL